MGNSILCVNLYERLMCIIARTLLKKDKAKKYIVKKSFKKYSYRNDLARYYFYKYQGVIIGRYTYGFEDIINNNNVKLIGAFSSIAKGCTVVPNDHRMDWVTTSPIASHKEFSFRNDDISDTYCDVKSRETTIGNDVWIGANSIIFEGVHISDGAVIAAGSIIRKNVPPYAVVCGVDTILKYRFKHDIVENLLAIKWWDWDDTKIAANINLMQNIDAFIKEYKL